MASAPHDSTTQMVQTGPWVRVRRLFAFVRPYRGRLAAAIVCLLCGSGLGLVYPSYFGRVIDAAFTDGDLDQLDRHSLVLVAVFLAQAAFTFFRHFLMTWLGERVVADIRGALYSHLVTLSQSYFQRRRTGELLSRLAEDVSSVQNTVGEDVSIALRNVLTLIGGIGILLWMNPFLTLVMLGVVPPMVLMASYLGRVIRRISKEAHDELARANGELQEGISGIETVQAFTREAHVVGRYADAISATFGLFVRRAWIRSWFMAGASFAMFSALAGIFWLGGRMVVSGEITAGELTSFMLYTMLVAGAVGAMAGSWSSLQTTLGATSRLFEILDERPTIANPPEAKRLADARGHVRFDGVTFAYGDRDDTVLREVSLDVPPGESCALVGASGSGKTTVARLLQRFYDPDEGSISVDGVDLRELDVADLRGHMAVVSQDPILFSGSIADNIRFGKLDATQSEIEAAAKAAHAHDFITAFPDGYDTVVGERGVKLSGGQRQRVSIARALLRDPRILILDEATSALDAESEHLVQAALEHLERGRTTVVIAHRLSTVRDADQIVVLDHGGVAERGTHDALVAAGGEYHRLIQRQSEAAADVPASA